MSRWQSSLRSVESVTGRPGDVGAITRLIYREAGRDVPIVETVLESTMPTAVVSELRSQLMTSTMTNRFVSVTPNRTRWIVECNMQFHGLWRLFGWLAPRLIVRKTARDMARFKAMVESL